tara:strand:+ start:590 stop:2839 length:2250 start_codon:yes stop_codon:yes gene_type:complete
MAERTWKDRLEGEITGELTREIELFETQMAHRQTGQLDEKVFAETRLRRGVYGQRYDNGQRHDGIAKQELGFSRSKETKGPETLWDAPGMLRIKIPWGGMTARQLELMAELAEEYSDRIAHVTTRQDIQLHFIHIDDTPDIMRRLASVGITTQEACGNSIRNVTACPISGVCHDESFDVSPYAEAFKTYFLGHPDAQNFGRKFKAAFSGCEQHACGLAIMHDMAFIAAYRTVDGVKQRGFKVYVGGGLGAVPHQAQLYEEFVPEHEILPLGQAMCRVFGRLGEKRNRARARLKFLVAKLGLDEFKKLVTEERAGLPEDSRWTSLLSDAEGFLETPLRGPSALSEEPGSVEYQQWFESNVQMQRQEGYAVVTIALPLGDLTADQMRGLADVARIYTGDHIRATVEQNIVLRWIPLSDLPAVYTDLASHGLASPGAGTIVDITACPGTDTCKLGISASRGLASELHTKLGAKAASMDTAIRDLRVKISGCFNACGQHHISDIGFYGVSRKVGGHNVPHFQVVLGGQWSENAKSFGLAMGAVPSKNIPDALSVITERYLADRQGDESFQAFVSRIGKVEIKTMLKELTQVPGYEVDRSYYSDWADPREYSLGDMGIGECAGAVVAQAEMGLARSESEVFEAQVCLDKNDPDRAAALAYQSMLLAAQALIREQNINITDEPEHIVSEFRTRFFETKLFHDPFAGGKFANYFFRIHDEGVAGLNFHQAHQRVEEAQLFIEAAHSCYARMSTVSS